MSLLSRMDDRTELMGRMMRTVGVEQYAATGLALERELRTAFFRCQGCRAADECKVWLDGRDEGAAPPAFCPNAGFFSACAGEGKLDID